MIWALLVVAVVALAYFVFKDTLNRLQYIQTLRLYWIVRDNGTNQMPNVTRAFMRQTSAPWWRGTGIQFRVRTRTFQVGILRERVAPVNVFDMDEEAGGLLAQLGGRELDVDAKTIRKEWR
jgi:hypothetical protein